MPDAAAAIYARNETFRQFLGNLGITVIEYNRLQNTLNDVEPPLIVRELAEIDRMLERGIAERNWNSEGVADYCVGVKNLVDDLSSRLQASKANVAEITEKLAEWFAKPMLVRDEKTGLLSHHDRHKKLQKVTN